MSLTKQDIQHIARLARLEVSEQEIPDYLDKMSSILALVEQLGQVDTGAVLPMAHPLEMSQRLRADAVTESDHRDLYQQNSAAAEQGLYIVPRVVE